MHALRHPAMPRGEVRQKLGHPVLTHHSLHLPTHTAGRAAQGQSRSPSPNHSYMGGGVALEKQGIIRRSQAGEEERCELFFLGGGGGKAAGCA